MGEKKTVEALARQFQDQIERILTEKVAVFDFVAVYNILTVRTSWLPLILWGISVIS